MNARQFSGLLGVTELLIAVLIAARPFSAKISAVGSALAVGMLLTTLSFLLSTPGDLGKNLIDTVVTRKEHTLVTTGPYCYVRHPFQLAFFMAVIGGASYLRMRRGPAVKSTALRSAAVTSSVNAAALSELQLSSVSTPHLD